MLSESEKQTLLHVAWTSITAAVRGIAIELPHQYSETLRRPAGAFVSLRVDGNLRGCIGYVDPIRPLIQVVQEISTKAALTDSRFIPLEEDELSATTIEISVLSPLGCISDVNEIQIGTHGLVVEMGNARGVLLPQIPCEHGWDRETFLCQTTKKAGLHPDTWQHPEARIFVFTSELFREQFHSETRQ